MEKWLPVLEFEGFYEVSSLGNIRGVDKYKKSATGNGVVFIPSKPVRARINKNNGYYTVNLCKYGGCRTYTVHSIVAKAFIPNPENKNQTNHIDGDKLNNRVDNLEWVTKSENAKHAVRTGLTRLPTNILSKDTHPTCKITEAEAVEAFRLGQLGLKAKVIAETLNVPRGSVEYVLKYNKPKYGTEKEQRA